MKTQNLVWCMLGAVIIVAGIAYVGRILTGPAATPTPSTSTSEEPMPSISVSGKNATSSLRNLSLKANDEISSPLTITGEARGWYFEASFPVYVTDWDGKIIAQGPAQAKGDWMTSEYVPFVITLTFAKPTGQNNRGTIILHNDNPSGMPENDAAWEIPVRFK